MQHTDKYKLDLIEKEDAFSPDALNENTQKVEEALIAHEGAVKEVTDGLDQRVTVLEAHKFACGSFQTPSDNGPLVVELGFTPKAVFISRQRSDHPDCLILITQSETKNMYLRIVEGGFRHICNNGYTAYGGTYHFIAFA